MSFSLPGLASGLDTATLIQQLMQIERIPYQKLEQKQTTINSQLSTFRTLNTRLETLRSAAEELMQSSSFNIRTASNSNESVLRATVSDTAADASYAVNVKQLATQHSIKTNGFSAGGDDLVAGEGEEPLEITISGNGSTEARTFTLRGETNEEVLTNLMNDINAGKVGVKASIIETKPGEKTLVLTADKFGEANSITFGTNTNEDEGVTDTRTFIDGGAALQSLGFMTNDGDMNESVPVQNAVVIFNGIEIESSSNDLNNVISGMSLTLLQEGETTINVTKDMDKITEKVEAFVKAYNDVINTVRSNSSEGRGLQGDSTLRSLQNHMHSLLNQEFAGNEAFNYLYQIGLEVDKGVTSGNLMTGTITFDKEKFQAALAENPDEVFNLFAFNDTSEANNDGIARLFRDSMRDWTRAGSGIITTKIEGYNEEISLLNKRMEEMNIRLQMKEDQLKRQFTAMETALVQLQNQQSWMMSQIASMGLN